MTSTLKINIVGKRNKEGQKAGVILEVVRNLYGADI
jgi:hypothetical protein